MCNSACYHVLCHASSVDPQGDNILATLIYLHYIPSNTRANSLSSSLFESNWILFEDSYNRRFRYWSLVSQKALSLQNHPYH